MSEQWTFLFRDGPMVNEQPAPYVVSHHRFVSYDKTRDSIEYGYAREPVTVLVSHAAASAAALNGAPARLTGPSPRFVLLKWGSVYVPARVLEVGDEFVKFRIGSTSVDVHLPRNSQGDLWV